MPNWSFGTQLPEGSESKHGDLLRAGDRFGPYTILAQLGAGGSGHVLHARGPDGEVALKLLLGTLDDTRRERFRREGELARGLRHPGIVRLLAGGEVGAVPFLAYELVSGGADFRARLSLASVRGRVAMLAQVAAALGFAHSQGVVHRDLKPDNLLVDSEGRVRVADFGLALASEHGRLTQTGEVVGTPLYMAPEQTVLGAEIGPACDVWAIGVLLYEAITGARPFTAPRWLDLRARIQEAQPAQPRDLNPTVPPSLEAVCLRALAGSPARRYPNGLALARALEDVLAGGTVPNDPAQAPALTVERARLETSSGPFPLGPLGRFELRELIGRGAMGVVYRALDPELGREVALKFILSAKGTRRLERFRREGEITASFSHPAILKVHGTGVLEGIPFLVYELVPGARSLLEGWSETDPRGRVAMLRDAARGLGHAHGRGVIHRDVKPDNILVDRDGRVLVADFGLAAAQGMEKLTRTGAVVGTPAYMAPELISGEREQVGPHTDVWALGVMLYELLAGQRPFRGSSMVELSVAITSAAPRRPRDLDVEVDRELESVCLKAIQKDPRDRYEDGEAFAAELDAWLEGRRVSASTAAMGLKPLMRRGWRLSLLLAPLLLGLLAVGLVLFGGDRPGALAQPPKADSSPQPADRGAQPREEWLAEGRLAAREARAHEEVEARRAALSAWLERYEEHPLAGELRAALEADRAKAPLRVLNHGRAGQVHVAFLSDEVLLSCGEQGTVVRWNLRDGLERDRLELSPGIRGRRAVGPAIGLDEDRALVASVFSVYWVEFSTGRREQVKGLRAQAFSLSPDRKQLAVGTDMSPTSEGWQRPCVVVLDAEREEERARLEGFRQSVTALTHAPDGSLIALSGIKTPVGLPEDCELSVWEPGGALRLRRPFRTLARSVTVPPSGELAVVGTLTGELLAIDLATGDELYDFVSKPKEGDGALLSLNAHAGSVKAAVFSLDGARLYSMSTGRMGTRNRVRVWDTSTREEVASLTLRGERHESLTISPDGTLLAVGSKEGYVELWAVVR